MDADFGAGLTLRAATRAEAATLELLGMLAMRPNGAGILALLLEGVRSEQCLSLPEQDGRWDADMAPEVLA